MDKASLPRTMLKSRFVQSLKRLLVVSLFIYVGVVGLFVSLERFLVYPAPPRSAGDWQPTSFAYEDVSFASADGTQLHGWYLAHPDPEAYLLVNHGNGEHVGFLGDWADWMRDEFDVAVFLYDYRGYGRSGGKPAEAGVLADGEAAIEEFARQAETEPAAITPYGRSIGGAVAVHQAARYRTRGLVLDRTFHSMVEIAADMYRWMPVRWLMHNRYESQQKIRDYEGPLLQMHGTADSIVPLASGRMLFDASPSEQKEWIEVPGLGHNDPEPLAFFQALERFLREL